jgi:hypothetical protein
MRQAGGHVCSRTHVKPLIPAQAQVLQEDERLAAQQLQVRTCCSMPPGDQLQDLCVLQHAAACRCPLNPKTQNFPSLLPQMKPPNP